MWPRIGPIPTYSIFYLLGLAAHFFLCWRFAHRLHLKKRIWLSVSLCYFLGMYPCATILYHVRLPDFDPAIIFQTQTYLQGGLWGGLLAYILLAGPLVWLLNKQRRASLDLIALTIPIPWILARTGCLFNGCCYGRACSLPWAITFPEQAEPAIAGIAVHPTQVYDMLLMGLVLVVFRLLPPDRWRGTLLLWFLSIYGLGRATIDVFRGDMDRYTYLGFLTLTQLICLLAAAGSLALLLLSKRLKPQSGQLPC